MFNIKKNPEKEIALIEINNPEEWELIKHFVLKHNWRYSQACTDQRDWERKDILPDNFPYYLKCDRLSYGIYCNFIVAKPTNIIRICDLWERVGFYAKNFDVIFLRRFIYP